MRLELDNVTKVYRMGAVDVPALRGISLRIAPGEFVAVMGPSGSGKSTCMNILGLLDRPTTGRCLFDERDVASLSDRERAHLRNQRLGFVFQSFNLLPRTPAIENVELPMVYAGRYERPRAQAVLERVGLAGRTHHLPTQLSGGEQQRVAIARALVMEPAVILADEPTGNLDSATSGEIMALLEALNREGITVVLVTHEADVAAHAKRIVRFRDGRIERDERNLTRPAPAGVR
jgi:putative ABC transport system ATP-binding protein